MPQSHPPIGAMAFWERWGTQVKEDQREDAEKRRRAEKVFAKANDAIAEAIAEIEAQPLQFQSLARRRVVFRNSRAQLFVFSSPA